MLLKDVKHCMADKSTVTFRGLSYYISAVIMRIRENDWYYQLELHDLKANSITIAAMSEVEERKENG